MHTTPSNNRRSFHFSHCYLKEEDELRINHYTWEYLGWMAAHLYLTYMKLEDLAQDPLVFWTALAGIVGVAGLIGSALTQVVASLWGWWRRPRPAWFFSLNPTTRSSPNVRSAQGYLYQIGDAAASSVVVNVPGANLMMSELFVQEGNTFFAPRVNPGDKIPVRVYLLEEPRTAGQSINDLKLSISWFVPPIKQKRNRRKSALFSIAGTPMHETNLTRKESEDQATRKFDRDLRRLERGGRGK